MRGIYGIEHRGRIVYVGSSINMRRRWQQHRNTLRRSRHRNYLLQRIHDKYPEGLTFVALEVVPVGDLATAEDRWIAELQPYTNISDARGSHPHTEEAKAKMRAYVKTASIARTCLWR